MRTQRDASRDVIGLSVSEWKYGKSWVYSITYDEALADLKQFVVGTHEELGIPGHVEVVAGQIGQIRDCGASSYNGMRHMDAGELRELISMGWGVGNHSYTHGIVLDNPDLELRVARETIETAIDMPVTLYTSPGNNDNFTPEVREYLRSYGYLAGMSITDDINRPEAADLLWVNRSPLHERYWGVFDCAYDAHKRISQAREEHGWIVDYCHCPLEIPIHEYKDCSAAHHRQRLETIAAEGGAECWYANPDDVVDYRYMRSAVRVEDEGGHGDRFVVRLESLPETVRIRELTFLMATHLTPEVLVVRANGKDVPLTPHGSSVLHFTTTVSDGMSITIERKYQQREKL